MDFESMDEHDDLRDSQEQVEKVEKVPKGKEEHEKKVKRPTKPRPKVNMELLEGPKGLDHVFEKFPDSFRTQFKGKGHEISDLRNLLEMYSRWQQRIFPHCSFDDFIIALEKLSGRNMLKDKLRQKRTDLLVVADPEPEDMAEDKDPEDLERDDHKEVEAVDWDMDEEDSSPRAGPNDKPKQHAPHPVTAAVEVDDADDLDDMDILVMEDQRRREEEAMAEEAMALEYMDELDDCQGHSVLLGQQEQMHNPAAAGLMIKDTSALSPVPSQQQPKTKMRLSSPLHQRQLSRRRIVDDDDDDDVSIHPSATCNDEELEDELLELLDRDIVKGGAQLTSPVEDNHLGGPIIAPAAADDEDELLLIMNGKPEEISDLNGDKSADREQIRHVLSQHQSPLADSPVRVEKAPSRRRHVVVDSDDD